MESIDAKKTIIDGYIKNGGKVLNDTQSGLCINLNGNEYVVTKEDIKEYGEFMDNKQKFANFPCECSICSTTYREHLLISIDSRRLPLSFLFSPFKTNLLFQSEKPNGIEVQIGFASKDFFNFFRFDKNFIDSYFRHIFMPENRRKSERDIRSITQRILTIKVHNIAAETIEDAQSKSSRVIEDCLFQLSYLKDISLWLTEEWPNKKYFVSLNRFTFGESHSGNIMPLKATYNSDIVRFYQFGKSSNIPEMKFLSFYHVLEYFFVQTSNEKLNEKLSYRLKDPKFTISATNLNCLVQDVVKHKTDNNETEMLKNVLNKYVDEQELILFLEDYERFLKKPIYTKKHNVFGVSIEVRLEIGHTISNIAKQIKEIRNALVHSTDRYENNTRHIPFTKSTIEIEEQIPLMKFLAEKVIVNSALPYT